MALELIVILNGIFSIIAVIISLIIGLTIASKYRKYKQKTFLYVGFTSIGIFSTWWASSISFLLAIFNENGLQDFPSVYFIIAGLLTTPTLISWMLALDSLMEKNKKRQLLMIILSIESIIMEIIYLAVAVNNSTLIGDLMSPVDFHTNLIGIIAYANLSILIMSVNVNFTLKSMKSPVPEVRLKGMIILLAGILFFVCAFADVVIPLDILGLTIIRILLIFSAFLFYCGYLLPNFVKKIFLK